jgi:hypothetical protein
MRASLDPALLGRAAQRIWAEGQSYSLIQKLQSGSTTLNRPPLADMVCGTARYVA